MSNASKRRGSLLLNTSMSVAAVAATLSGWAVLSNQQTTPSNEIATPEPIVIVAEAPAVELPVLPTVVPLTSNSPRIIRIPNASAGGSSQPSTPNQRAPATGGNGGSAPSQAAPPPSVPRQVAPAPAPAAPAVPSRDTRSSR
ncbi:hypothetical protein [Herpetosiphon llansteffanensis]|uniref:hypothetical protein n=1 Tax=Herpetosiphon llansteffanensis TaxID=2094568 RepID=UPI0013DFDBE9|nr:hypothetical protein [Herpetosiphon llansteffanensis]